MKDASAPFGDEAGQADSCPVTAAGLTAFKRVFCTMLPLYCAV